MAIMFIVTRPILDNNLFQNPDLPDVLLPTPGVLSESFVKLFQMLSKFLILFRIQGFYVIGFIPVMIQIEEEGMDPHIMVGGVLAVCSLIVLEIVPGPYAIALILVFAGIDVDEIIVGAFPGFTLK